MTCQAYCWTAFCVGSPDACLRQATCDMSCNDNTELSANNFELGPL